MTRFEKLKTMTVEEIAEWWWEHMACNDCPICPLCGISQNGTCVENRCITAVKNYLNSEEPEVSLEDEVCVSCAIDYPQEEISAEQIIGEEENDESKTGD